MGSFRRISVLKLYAISCTFLLTYLLLSSFQPDVLEELNKLQRELRQLRRENVHLQSFQEKAQKNNEKSPMIYLITPTYPRHTQKADMTRLLYTLMHVRNLHWIIIEDADNQTKLISDFIKNRIPSSIVTSHLVQKTPTFDKLGDDDPNWLKPRGVQQRNVAIQHLTEQFKHDQNGLVYFMDDDNTYTIEVFNEIRKIKG